MCEHFMDNIQRECLKHFIWARHGTTETYTPSWKNLVWPSICLLVEYCDVSCEDWSFSNSDGICGFNMLTVGPLNFWHSSGSQNCNPESAASATHENLLERQVLWLHPLGHGTYLWIRNSVCRASNLCFNQRLRWFWYMPKLENQFFRGEFFDYLLQYRVALTDRTFPSIRKRRSKRKWEQ